MQITKVELDRRLKAEAEAFLRSRIGEYVERHGCQGILDALLATGRVQKGACLIAAERQRQVEDEGWTRQHDDEHDAAELAMAAFAYTLAAIDAANGTCWEDEDGAPLPPPERLWPWHSPGAFLTQEQRWEPGFKPSDDPIPNLIKAGALIAAEIDRLERRGS